MVQNNHILSQTNADKALVKSTGEIQRIKNRYAKFTVEVKLNIDNDNLKEILDSYKFDLNLDDIPEFIKDSNISISEYKISDKCNENVFYLLEDSKSYNECDLIVGSDNKRF